MPKPIIPIVGFRPPEPPSYGGLGQEGWSRGTTFLEFVNAAGTARAEIETAFAGVQLPPALAEFFATYPRRVRVLGLGDTGSVDSQFALAQSERLFSFGSNIWMRIFDPESHPDLVQRFGLVGPQGPPCLILFGDDRREFGRWGPRSAALEALLATPAGPHEPAQRREWYTAAHGLPLARELRALLGRHAGLPAS